MEGLRRLSEVLWELPASGGMRVPGRIYADDEHDPGAAKGTRVSPRWATWPICPASSAARWPCPTSTGATASPSAGWPPSSWTTASSRPGGVGYDINCGVPAAGDAICTASDSRAAACATWWTPSSSDIPSGVGSTGAISSLSRSELEKVLMQGAGWAVEQGYGARGRPRPHRRRRLPWRGADPDAVSERAYERGLRPARHAGLRQSLPGAAGGRRDLRPGGRRAPSVCSRGR